MRGLKLILIGLAIAAVLTIAIIMALGSFGEGEKAVETTSMTVGDRTITVTGHYKNTSQETYGDGQKIVVDDHVIAATPDELTIDGKAQSFDPSQDVDIVIDEKGGLRAKAASADAGSQRSPE